MPRSLVPPSGAREKERQGKEEEVGDGGWYGEKERERDRELEGGLAGARGWKRGVCSGR